MKISIALSGHVTLPETRTKISSALKGRTISDEWRAKIALSHWRGGKKVARHRVGVKRRGLGYVDLNAWFPGCEGHHVDDEQVIHMPKKLHQSIYHRQSDGMGMAKMNAMAYNFLFKQELEALCVRGLT